MTDALRRLRTLFSRMMLLGGFLALIGGTVGGVMIANSEMTAGVVLVSAIGGGGCFACAMGIWSRRKVDAAIHRRNDRQEEAPEL